MQEVINSAFIQPMMETTMSLLGTTDTTKEIHAAAPTPARELKNQRIAIITGDKAEDVEFFYPYYRFNEAGYTVDVITENGGSFECKHGLGLKDSKSIESVNPGDYTLLYLPGGKAPASLRENESVLNFVRSFCQSGRTVAAICHGPQILASAGVISGKTLSAFPEVRQDLEDAGASWTDEALQIEGQFITARYPGDLPRHLHGVMEALAKTGSSNDLRSAA